MAETLYSTVTWTAGDTITEAKLDSMVANDRAVDAMLNGVQMTERADPSNGDVPANTVHVYAKDSGGYSELYQKESNNNVSRVGVPAGVIVPFGSTTAPDGWLLCYGQAVSRTTYAKLFGVISTSFGVGDGSTTFNVPDMRGRVPLGKDDLGGSSANVVTDADADTIGNADGEETHVLTTAEMPSHSHDYSYNARDASGVIAGGPLVASDGSGLTEAVSSTGGGGAHNNLQPYRTVAYIVKY